ncbi:MAG: glycosyltransferase family protein [Acidimicrobiia bacterium]
MNDPLETDLYEALAREDIDQLVEFIEQLQNAVDAADETAARRLQRVEKLEADRDVLRARLEQANRTLRRYREHPAGRIASRLVPTDKPSQPVAPSAEPADATPPRLANTMRVATILDAISDACWSPEFENVRVRRATWESDLQRLEPDVLFVESAFGGVDGSWAGRIAHFGSPHADLVALVSTAKDMGIPTVFWNKEDPVNYGWFIGAASLFDHVFTVDEDQISRYEDDLPAPSIAVLPFAAQPTLHHPPPPGAERNDRVAFAGSYYARKHAARREQMQMLLTPALGVGLDIFDRMHGSNDARFSWPSQFESCVVGSVPYRDMGDVYRAYGVVANINTVTASPTMCARRVFELAACGAPIVSGPSLAIQRIVPKDVATVVTTSSEARSAYEAALELQGTTVGPEWIAGGHTYADRWQAIVEHL